MEKSKTIVIIMSIILILIVWGLIGSSQVHEIGNTCDLGINDQGSVFCWKWHQNVLGDIGDKIDEVLGNGN